MSWVVICDSDGPPPTHDEKVFTTQLDAMLWCDTAEGRGWDRLRVEERPDAPVQPLTAKRTK